MMDRPASAYAVFGGVLRSEIPFPDLPPAQDGAPADWTLRHHDGDAPACELHALGWRAVGAERYSLGETPWGFRLAYSHAGTFDLDPATGEIGWYPIAGAAPELVRAIVLGPVLALALEAAGELCLHGSAVAVGGAVVAFLGPKYHGKSTLATALAAAGARLVTDDLVAVVPGPPTRVRDGVASVRLWGDSARHLQVDSLCSSVVCGIKTTASGFGDWEPHAGRFPIAAVYLLAPVMPEDGVPPLRRVELSRPAAVVALAQQAKVPDSLVGFRGAGRRLRTAAVVAGTTPVYSLELRRDFDALSAAVDALMEWHSPLAAGSVS